MNSAVQNTSVVHKLRPKCGVPKGPCVLATVNTHLAASVEMHPDDCPEMLLMACKE